MDFNQKVCSIVDRNMLSLCRLRQFHGSFCLHYFCSCSLGNLGHRHSITVKLFFSVLTVPFCPAQLLWPPWSRWGLENRSECQASYPYSSSLWTDSENCIQNYQIYPQKTALKNINSIQCEQWNCLSRETY